MRSSSETAEGTLLGAREIPLVVLTSSLATLDRTKAIVVYCATGYRSQVAASVLRAAGFPEVSDLLGGYDRVGRRRASSDGRGDAHLSVRSGRCPTVLCGFARDGTVGEG